MTKAKNVRSPLLSIHDEECRAHGKRHNVEARRKVVE